MASIFEEQNQPHLLRCLVAQRKKYSLGKRISLWATWITAGGVIMCVVGTGTQSESSRAICCLLAVIYQFAVRYLDCWGNKMFANAATIQQYFDYMLFHPRLVGGENQWYPLPTQSDVAEIIAPITDQQIDEQCVRNWYEDYSYANPDRQVYLSQRQNIRWNLRQDRRYFRTCIAVVLLVVLAMIVVGISGNVHFSSVMCLLCWLLPLLERFFRRLYVMWTRIQQMEKTKQLSNALDREWKSLNISTRTKKLLMIQNELRSIRKKGVGVPDWFYRLFRQTDQTNESNCAKSQSCIEKSEGC